MYQHYSVKKTVLLYTTKKKQKIIPPYKHMYVYECNYQYMEGIQEALKPNGICKAQLVRKHIWYKFSDILSILYVTVFFDNLYMYMYVCT